MDKKRILILTSSIGSGHRRAAAAVEYCLKEMNPFLEVKVINFFEYAHPLLAQTIQEFYFRLISSSPKMWDCIYDTQEGKARVIYPTGLSGFFLGLKVKKALEIALDEKTKKSLEQVLGKKEWNNSDVQIGMEEFLRMLDTRSEVLKKLYDAERDEINIPFASIREKMKLLKNLAQYLLFRSQALIEEERPDFIVCTQVLPCIFMAKVKEIKRYEIPLMAILTDFGVHSYWIRPGVDFYVVSTAKMKEKLISRGVAKETIYEYGMPLHPGFARASLEKNALKKKLGLKALFTLLIMGGGTGFGIDPFIEIKKFEKCKMPLQIIVIAGNNKELKSKLEGMRSGLKIPLYVYGYVDNVEEFMASADLLVSKPGGLTISESLVSSLPMVLIKAIQGQEQQNYRFLLEEGIAIDGKKGRAVLGAIHRFMQNPRYLEELRKKARSLAHPDSAEKIACLIREKLKS